MHIKYPMESMINPVTYLCDGLYSLYLILFVMVKITPIFSKFKFDQDPFIPQKLSFVSYSFNGLIIA